MQIVESFGKNVFVGEKMVGYIDRQGIFINRQKFADITPEGEISFGAKKLGYVDEDAVIKKANPDNASSSTSKTKSIAVTAFIAFICSLCFVSFWNMIASRGNKTQADEK